MATLALNPATAPLLSVEEYLSTSFRPDRDYVDGVLEERNVGESEHGLIQNELGFLFRLNEKAWGTRVIPECRLQVGSSKFRVPDLVVLRRAQAFKRVIREAPLLCVEILSPEDTWTKLRVRLDEYIALGVENIWCFDPIRREVRRYSADGYRPVAEAVLTIPGTPIAIDVAAVFAAQDED